MSQLHRQLRRLEKSKSKLCPVSELKSIPCITGSPRLCCSTVTACVSFLPAPKHPAHRDDVTQNSVYFLSNVSIKLEPCTLCCSFWLQHTGSSLIYFILSQPHDPPPPELFLSHFCRPGSLEQPLPNTELSVGFLPRFHTKITTTPT